MMVHIGCRESSWPCLSALFDQWLTWKSPPVSAFCPPWSSFALSFFFSVPFLLGVGQASLLGGFRHHSRRLAVGQVHIAGEIEERGHILCENHISNKQKKIHTIVTLAEAKPLEFPTTELTCATVAPPVPQGPFSTHVLERFLTDSTQPPHPTLAVGTSHVTVLDFQF